MVRAALLALTAATALAACGDDGHDDDHDHFDAAATPDAAAIDADPGAPDADPTAPDAAPAPDAEPSSVVEVTCPGSPDATVTAPSFSFTIVPDATIPVNGIVRFEMPGSHSVVSGTVASPTTEFPVGFNETKCFQFTEAGSYPFYCNPHQFTATLTVQ